MKVAIIGAGLAGLASAQALVAKGHEVTVLEKSRGRGGRLARKKLDWGQMDIGAQYFTARGERFIAQCDQWQRAGVIAQWQFSPCKITDGQLLASPDDQVRWVGVPTMNALAHQLAEGLDVRLSTRVGTITKGGQLQGEAGEDLGRYDFVLVAVPAQQAAQLLAEFDLAKAIPSQALVPCWAVGLLAAAKQAVDPAIQGIFGDNTVKWVSRDSAKPGRELTESGCDLWQLHMSPQWSAAHPKEANPEVLTTATKWLETALNTPLQAVSGHSHFWRYANIERGFTGVDGGFLNAPDDKVAVIGDWCSGGRVEGAYNSALKCIDALF